MYTGLQDSSTITAAPCVVEPMKKMLDAANRRSAQHGVAGDRTFMTLSRSFP